MRYKTGDVVAVQYVFTSVQQSRFRQDSFINNPIYGIVTNDQIIDTIFVKFTDDRMHGIRSYSESEQGVNSYYENSTGMYVQISKVADGILPEKTDETNKEQ